MPPGSILATARNGTRTYFGGTFPGALAELTGTNWTLHNVAGSVHALAVQGHHLYIGGSFTAARSRAGSTTAASNVAAMRVTEGTVHAMGAGTNGPVFALTADVNGGVWVGGNFSTAGGMLSSNVAMWTGSSWWAAGNGTDGVVNAIATTPAGRVVVGGSFTTAGGAVAPNVAVLSGVVWSGLSSGLQGGRVLALAVNRTSQAVYVGGSFSGAGAVVGTSGIAVWFNGTWESVGGGVTGGEVRTLAFAGGSLLAGGDFTDVSASAAGDIPYMARFDGNQWSSPGSNLNGPVNTLSVDPLGGIEDVVIGGTFTSAGGIETGGVVAAVVTTEVVWTVSTGKETKPSSFPPGGIAGAAVGGGALVVLVVIVLVRRSRSQRKGDCPSPIASATTEAASGQHAAIPVVPPSSNHLAQYRSSFAAVPAGPTSVALRQGPRLGTGGSGAASSRRGSAAATALQ